MFSLYPMKFSPLFMEKIWGGEKINLLYKLSHSSPAKLGEAWTISAVPRYETHVANGHFAGNSLSEMSEIFMDDFIGTENFENFENNFPLLIKLIEANDFLSVQVHPDDNFARTKLGLPFGKSEFWYILEAAEDACIYAGFNCEMNEEKLRKHIENGTLPEVLKKIPVRKSDGIFIPAGLVHALGPGILLAEIQQSCDVTYRLFDWDRSGVDGNPRELHIEQAVKTIHYKAKPKIIRNDFPQFDKTIELIQNQFFVISLIKMKNSVSKNLSELDSFVLYFCIDGVFHLQESNQVIKVNAGECVLVPAIIEKILLIPESETSILEIYIA